MTRYAEFTGLSLALSMVLLSVGMFVDAAPTSNHGLFARKNLVAWCIVPFDAAERSSLERAKMLKSLGITKLAYDWRDEHVSTFAEEIAQCKRHKIEFFAFWGWHDDIAELVTRHEIHPQFWLMIPKTDGDSGPEKVIRAAEAMLPVVRKCHALGCKVALYNHGGWEGEPENLIAVCQELRELTESEDVGIVYNLHHAHDRVDDLGGDLERMMPYLLCLNLNGMNALGSPKILPIGEGDQDQRVLKTIVQSGYKGPIGIIDHRPETDAEKSLRANLEGISKLTELKLDD